MPKPLHTLVITVVCLALWQLVLEQWKIPAYLLPSPKTVAITLVEQRSLLSHHAMITVQEALLGLFVGCCCGISTALIMLLAKPIQRVLMPLLVVSQALPTFAIAPLLVFWLGYGRASKVMTAALMLFFPVTTALYDGLRRTPQAWLDLAKLMGSPTWSTVLHVQLPAALPSLASGIRVATAIAPIGAVVGEWVGASQGLGFLMLEANARLQIDMLFAALVVLTSFSLLLYRLVDRLLIAALPWATEAGSP